MSRKAEDGVDEDVRVAFLGLRNQQTACPPVERLVDFHDGRLTAEAHRVVADHVILCGTCDFLIERIKSSEEAARVEAAAIPPAEWRSIDRRLTRSFESALSGRIDSRRGVPGRVALFWHPAVAYALTVILAYPAYLGIVSKLRVAPPIERKESTPAAESSAAVQLARSFDLSRTRGAGEDGATSVELGLSQQDKIFILSFFVPARPGLRYVASVIGGNGRITVAEQELGGGGQQGNYSLVCQRESFAQGEYALIVKEITPADGRISRQFTFRFRL